MTDTATKIIQRPDGSEALLLRKAALEVLEGPDKGRRATLEQPRLVIGSGVECGLRLTDPTVSNHHVELTATESGYLVRDLGSTNGTLVGGVRVLSEVLVSSQIDLSIGQSRLRVSPTADTVELPLSLRSSFGELLGQSSQMRQIFAILERVASADSTVLLEGESGTGKELAAHSIHEHSSRREQPFMVIDCGAIPANLLESELFGHERGAFTGAHATRKGALEEADGGTVFLDEVTELPLDLQPKLLRFLERRQIKRVGASRHSTIDVRVVAATNRSLSAEVEAGRFREDLFYRLSVVRVEIPPLRDRQEDIRLLAHFFAQQHNPDSHEIITGEIESLLLSHRWPGNVRQLRNMVERLSVLPELATMALREEGEPSLTPSIGRLAELPFHEARRRWQEIFERQYLTTQLDRSQGVVTRAAESAGLPRQSFHRLLRRHGLTER
jgi:transcriptional regulator with GAF, ATPase, and Fis domain